VRDRSGKREEGTEEISRRITRLCSLIDNYASAGCIAAAWLGVLKLAKSQLHVLRPICTRRWSSRGHAACNEL
jgi:hypothetical protein